MRDKSSQTRYPTLAVLGLPLDELINLYDWLPLEEGSRPLNIDDHSLDSSVVALLEEVDAPQ